MVARSLDSVDKKLESSIEGDISRSKMTKSAGIVAFCTSLSRVSGLMREILTAHLFGATAATDAFNAAYTIPNAMRRLVAEGALTVSFIPVYTDLRKRGTEEEATEFFRATLGLLSVFLVFLVAAGVLGASFLVYAFASGFSVEPEKFALTTSLTQLMFPYVFSISLVGLFMGALNSRGHFAVTAASPVLLNLATMGGAYFLRGWFAQPLMGQALGVIIGGVLQLVIHLPVLHRYGLLKWPTFNYRLPGVIRLGRLLIPSLIGVAAYQINLIVLKQIGSHLPNGQLTIYGNADRLMQLALGIFAISIATAALPTMSAQSASGEKKQLFETWSFSAKLTNFITIPAAAGLFIVAVPITSVLWMHGAYTWEKVQLTAYTTMAFAPGLIAVAMMRTIVQVFYALQDMKTPVKISVACIAINLILGLAFLPYEVVGLAIAYTLSCCVQVGMLLYWLRRKIGPIGARALLRTTMMQLFSAGAACGLAWLIALLGMWEQGPTPLNIAVLLAAVCTAMVTYALLAHSFGSQEAEKLWALVRERLPGKMKR